MNEEHLTDEQVERFLQRQDLSEFEQIDRHLAVCERCRARLCATLPLADTYRALEMEFGGPPETDHLTCPLAIAYIDGSLDEVDREIADLHLERCERCNRAITGLRQAKILMQAHREGQQAENAPPTPSVSPEAGGDRVPPASTLRLPWWSSFLRPQENQMRQSRTTSRIPLYLALPTVACLVILYPIIHLRNQAIDRLQHTVNTYIVKNQKLEQQQRQARNDLQANNRKLEQQARESKQTIQGLQQDRDRLALNLRAGQARNEDLVAMLPNLSALRSNTGSRQMGSDTEEKHRLLQPAFTEIDNQTPTLRWESVSDVGSYLLTITSNTQTSIEYPIPDVHTNFTVPKPLRPGETYTWSVRATIFKDTNAPQMSYVHFESAAFRILTDAESTRFRRNMAEVYQRAATYHWPQGRLHQNLGVAYMNAGLLDEAQQELEASVRIMPGDRIVQDWLHKIKAARQLKAQK